MKLFTGLLSALSLTTLVMTNAAFAWEALPQSSADFDNENCSYRLKIIETTGNHYLYPRGGAIQSGANASMDDASSLNFYFDYTHHDRYRALKNEALYEFPQNDDTFFSRLIGSHAAQSLRYQLGEQQIVPGSMRILFTNLKNTQGTATQKVDLVYSAYLSSSRPSDGVGIYIEPVITQGAYKVNMSIQRECHAADLKSFEKAITDLQKLDSASSVDLKSFQSRLSDIETDFAKAGADSAKGTEDLLNKITKNGEADSERAKNLLSELSSHAKTTSGLEERISALEKQNRRLIKKLNKLLDSK